MARGHQLTYALNAGGVDPEALARVDLEKMRLAGEHPVANWLPRVLGSMSIRPGLQSLYRIPDDDVTRMLPFVRSSTSANLLLLSDETMRIIDADGVPVPVATSSSVVLDPTFIGPAAGSYTTGWYNDSIVGDGTDPTVSFTTSLAIKGTDWRPGSVQQGVAIALADRAIAHTITFEVTLGPVLVRLGTAADGQDLLAETSLGTGTHKITVTPNAAYIYIKIRNETDSTRYVARVQFEHTALGAAGVMTIPTPWPEATLRDVSVDQSIDVMFAGDGISQQRRIERRGASSWSLAEYQTSGGPLVLPTSDTITLSSSAFLGDTTLTASLDYFDSSHVGGLFEITTPEQHVYTELNSSGQTTGYVLISGVYASALNDRVLGYAITATGWTGTIALERSTDTERAVWSQVSTFTGTVAATTLNDQQNNLSVAYRFRVTAYTAGSAIVVLDNLGGTKTGLVRITAVSTPTSATAAIINPIGSINTPTRNWRGPRWTSTRGWPRVPRIFDGRLWWFGGDTAYGSVVDDFTNYDDSVAGDSGPIIRSIGSGATEGAVWALDMQRLIVGTTGFEASIRSSSFDEPLTPTQFTVRNASTLGVANVPAVKVDRGAFFVQRAGRRVYELAYSGETNDYTSNDVSRLVPIAFDDGVVAMAVQRQPDTRVYFVLNTGTVVVLTYERDDKVVAFTTMTTPDGLFEDVVVLPGAEQDNVYFIVNRDGARYVERLGNERDQQAVATCALLDGYKVLTGSISSITGGTQWASQTVNVWADGARRTPVTLNGSGVAALGATYSRVVYGKSYDAEFESVKLAYAAQLGSAVGQTKIVRHAGLVLRNSCLDGIALGRDASHTYPLPPYVDGAERTASQFFATYDEGTFPVDADWDVDSRLYLGADSSYGPVTVQAIVMDIETRDGGNGNSQGGNG